MGSKYKYSVIRKVEDLSGEDYSAMADPFKDSEVNANITIGEVEINTKTGTTFTGARGYHEVGLTFKTGNVATGLTGATPYYFKIDIDGAGVIEYAITTLAAVTYDDVIPLMDAAIEGAFFHLVNGDLRCTSVSVGTSSTITLTAGTTGTDLFATLTGWAAFDAAVAGSGSIPDVIQELATDLCFRRLYNRMVWKGLMDRENPKREKMPIWDQDQLDLLEPYIAREESPIHLIPLYNNDPSVNIT